jgi:hypothetical protein
MAALENVARLRAAAAITCLSLSAISLTTLTS